MKADYLPAYTNAPDDRFVRAKMEGFPFNLFFFYPAIHLPESHCEPFHA